MDPPQPPQPPQPRQLCAVGERSEPERFMHSEHTQWSAFGMSQRGARQGSSGPKIEEAVAQEPALAAEL